MLEAPAKASKKSENQDLIVKFCAKIEAQTKKQSFPFRGTEYENILVWIYIASGNPLESATTGRRKRYTW